MGSFLSRKKKKEDSDSSTTKDEENLKSVDAAINNNRETLSKMKVGIIKNSTSVNRSRTTAFIPNQNNSDVSHVTQRKLDLPRVDFKVLENESPIERRRRIMSGDRRISYVMKLESLRREQLEKKLTEKNCVLLQRKFMKSFIQPVSVPENVKLTDVDKSENCNDNFQISHYQVDSNKNLNNNTCDGTNFYRSNQITKTNMEKSAEEKNFTSNLDNCDNNGLHRRNRSVLNKVSFNNNNSMCSNTNETISENKLHKNNIDVKQNTCTEMNKNVLNYNPVKYYYPVNSSETSEKNPENLASSSQEVANDSVDVKTQKSDKVHRKNFGTIKSNNPEDKISIDFYKMPRHIFNSNETNNSNNISVSTSEFRKKPSKITVGYDSIITFESDYSYHEFESDVKSDFTESTNLKDPSLSVVVTQETPSSSSISTILSYNKVKKLFQKRITESELYENKKKNKNNIYYKELEALGRGRWENGVWIPSGKLRATFFHNVCKKRD